MSERERNLAAIRKASGSDRPREPVFRMGQLPRVDFGQALRRSGEFWGPDGPVIKPLRESFDAWQSNFNTRDARDRELRDEYWPMFHGANQNFERMDATNRTLGDMERNFLADAGQRLQRIPMDRPITRPKMPVNEWDFAPVPMAGGGAAPNVPQPNTGPYGDPDMIDYPETARVRLPQVMMAQAPQAQASATVMPQDMRVEDLSDEELMDAIMREEPWRKPMGQQMRAFGRDVERGMERFAPMPYDAERERQSYSGRR